MDIHAYPTDATIPVDLAQARGIAARHLSAPGDAAAGITRVVTEFESGYTVTGIFGVLPDDPDAPVPPPIGGSVYVIDRATGAVSSWPTYSSAVVAEQYSEILRTGRLLVAEQWPVPEDFDEPAAGEPVPEEIVIDYEVRDGH